MLSQAYIVIVVLAFVSTIVGFAYYLWKLKKYIIREYPDKWKKMLDDNDWYAAPEWDNPYSTNRFFDFIWKSKEDYNDKFVGRCRLKIRRSMLCFVILFFGVPVLTFLLIYIRVLR